MAYVKAWSTKEDVLKDLATASGKRPWKKDDLAESYLVMGNAPPPLIPVDDENDEMEILFGEAASRRDMQTEENATPDLAGIQQMLRMVNSGDDECNDVGDAEVIAISKTVDVITEESKKDTKEQGKDSGDKCDSNLDNNINIDENKYEDIETTLKNQISDASQSDSYEDKKQKNVAIATLLRLYAKKKVSSIKCEDPIKHDEPIKLITPEYFEGKVASLPDVKLEHAVDVGSTATSSTPEPKDSSTTLRSSSTLSTSSSPYKLVPKVKIDPEIKKSIDKVNRWLEEPTERKSPAVCLGPIEFKRKDPINCKSPISDSTPKVTKPANQSQTYQPSKYAADLAKKYQERSKQVFEAAQKEVNWSNLDQVLKLKDEQLAMKQLEQSSTTS